MLGDVGSGGWAQVCDTHHSSSSFIKYRSRVYVRDTIVELPGRQAGSLETRQQLMRQDRAHCPPNAATSQRLDFLAKFRGIKNGSLAFVRLPTSK